MQPTVLNNIENFHNLSALRIFRDACMEWNYENKNFKYEVNIQTIYFDFGQNWKYTALVTTDIDKENSWQSFCPRDWELIVECMDVKKLVDMAWYYMDMLTGKGFENLYEKFE